MRGLLLTLGEKPCTLNVPTLPHLGLGPHSISSLKHHRSPPHPLHLPTVAPTNTGTSSRWLHPKHRSQKDPHQHRPPLRLLAILSLTADTIVFVVSAIT